VATPIPLRGPGIRARTTREDDQYPFIVSSATATNPYVMLLPYLEVHTPVEVGPWQLMPIGDFDGPWLSVRLEAFTRRFVEAFRGPRDADISKPTLVSHRHRGCDGVRPSDSELRALGRAIEFAALDQNPV
jgi:hypothetical protein